MLHITISETVRTLLIFILIYGIGPVLIMKGKRTDQSLIERFFMGFTAIILIQIIVTHLLIYLKLFDVVALIISMSLLLAFILSKDKDKETILLRLINSRMRLYDFLDSKTVFRDLIRAGKGRLLLGYKWVKNALEQVFSHPIQPVIFTIIFLLSAGVRFKHALSNYSYPHLDMYLHLKWIKAMIDNNLYLENLIYPKAMHAVIGFISEVTWSDPYWILRYFGPFFSVLIVLAIYLLALKVTKNRTLSILAMAIYGLSTNSAIFPSQIFRQTATMPQEFGILFILIGYIFLLEFLNQKKKRDLYVFLACLLISLMSHSYSGLFLILWTGITVIVALAKKQIRIKQVVRFVSISALVSAVSFFPLAIGKLLGKSFHETSLAMITDISAVTNVQISLLEYVKSIFVSNILFIEVTLVFILLLFFAKIVRPKGFYKLDFGGSSLIASTIFMMLMFNLSHLINTEALPELLDEARIGPFISLFIPIVMVLVIKVLTSKAHKRDVELVGYGLLVVFVLFSTFSGNISFNTFYKHYEYNQAAENYVKLRNYFVNKPGETGNWYVVSTDPQLAQVTGYGWYEEAYQFAQKYDPKRVSEKDFNFKFPVNNIYIFVEKKPLFNTTEAFNYENYMSLAPLDGDPFMQYYDNPDNRATMEARIWEVMKAYSANHNDVSIYYEDDSFMVYEIYQEKVEGN